MHDVGGITGDCSCDHNDGSLAARIGGNAGESGNGGQACWGSC